MNSLKNKAYRLLRQSETFFKTDMIYLATGGFWLTFGQILSSVGSFCLALILARTISQETYGTYKYVVSLASTLTLFSLKGMDGAFAQAVAQHKEGSFLKVLRAKITFGLVGSLTAFLLAIYYGYHGNTLLSTSLAIAGIFIAVSDSFFLYDSFLQGKQKFKASAMYTTISQIVVTVSIGVVAVLTKSAVAMLATYFIAWTLTRGFFLWRVLRTEHVSAHEDTRTISYGTHSSIINAIATISGSIDSILIFHYLGPINLAIYSFALAPVSQIKTLTDKLPTLAMPRFATQPVATLHRMLKRRLPLMSTIAVAIVGSYIIFLPAIYKILFPAYTHSINYSRFYGLILLLYIPYSLLGAALSAKLTLIPPKLLYLWNIPNLVMTGSAILLVTRFGVTGVIMARLISTLSMTMVGLYIWRYIRNLPEESFSASTLPKSEVREHITP
jgi:O-antigen/teichoic acid export membrane protein